MTRIRRWLGGYIIIAGGIIVYLGCKVHGDLIFTAERTK